MLMNLFYGYFFLVFAFNYYELSSLNHQVRNKANTSPDITALTSVQTR